MPTETYYLHRNNRTYPFRHCSAAPSLVNETVKSEPYQKTFRDTGPAIYQSGSISYPEAGDPYPTATSNTKVTLPAQPGVAIIPVGSVTVSKESVVNGHTGRVTESGLFLNVAGFALAVSDEKNPAQALRVDDVVMKFWNVPTEAVTGTTKILKFPFQDGDIFSNAPELGDDDDMPDA